MFAPQQIIFAPTARCNLHCAHCRVERGAAELPVKAAIAFMESCAANGVEHLGFSGGEPFLRPDFLTEVSRAAVKLDLLFDRLMTNAVWYTDPASLDRILFNLAEAGFDGKIAISYDSWHGQQPARVAFFIERLFSVFGRRDCAELVSVRGRDDARSIAMLRDLAALLGGRLLEDGGEPVAIVEALGSREPITKGDSPTAGNIGQEASGPSRRFPPPAEGEELRLRIDRLDYSAGSEENAWDSERWFDDDYCEGPGNVLYVHPNGHVAACCGFANENPALRIGDINKDGYSEVMDKARANPQVALCYDEGLGSRRAALEASGRVFPGKTRDICFFCDYLCRRGTE